MSEDAHSAVGSYRRRLEIVAFFFLTAVVLPLLTIAFVGGYGFVVWITQMILGPPGPPAA